jgi:hypothetical protein
LDKEGKIKLGKTQLKINTIYVARWKNISNLSKKKSFLLLLVLTRAVKEAGPGGQNIYMGLSGPAH